RPALASHFGDHHPAALALHQRHARAAQAPADVDHRDDLVAGLDDDRIADLGQRLVDPVDDVLDIGDRDREVAVPGADQEGLNHRELHWQAQAEDRAATGHRIDSHAALVAAHRLSDDHQADAEAGVVVSLGPP